MKIVNICTLFLILLLVSGCDSKSSSFIIEGNVSGTNNDTIFLLRRELQATTILDSTVISKNGDFKFKMKAQKYPEFYILRLNKQQLNIVVDSTETITIAGSINDFATKSSIKGSIASEDIQKVISAQQEASLEISHLDQQLTNKELSVEDYNLKIIEITNQYKEIAQEIIKKDLKSPAAYFALFQKDNQFLFFDPYNKKDYKLFAAVANVWNVYYPESPRSKQIKTFTLEALKIRKDEEATSNVDIRVDSISSKDYFTIDLPNLNNKNISLASLRGKYTILDFTVYGEPDSPNHNILLNKVYNAFKNELNIYQVSFDPDIHFWKNAASNIPWTAVYSDETNSIYLIKKFNIQGLPTTFLLNKQGTIVKRLYVNDEIESEIRKEI